MKWCINKRHVDLCRKYTNMHVKTARGNGSRMVEKNTSKAAAAAVLRTSWQSGYSAYVLRTLSKPLESLLLQLLFSGLIPRCLPCLFNAKLAGVFNIAIFCV